MSSLTLLFFLSPSSSSHYSQFTLPFLCRSSSHTSISLLEALKISCLPFPLLPRHTPSYSAPPPQPSQTPAKVSAQSHQPLCSSISGPSSPLVPSALQSSPLAYFTLSRAFPISSTLIPEALQPLSRSGPPGPSSPPLQAHMTPHRRRITPQSFKVSPGGSIFISQTWPN